MPRIRTDPHAMILAFAMASAFVFFCTRNHVLALPEAMRTWDRLLVWCAGGGALYAALFLTAHFGLRRLSIGARGLYAAAGAAACLLAFVILGAFGDLPDAFRRGVGASYLIFPTLIGGVFGFLYAWRAGWEAGADDPAVLAEAYAASAAEPGAGPDAPALLRTEGEAYFSGPLQVRTSVPLMLLAALFGSLLHGLVRGVMLVGHEVSLLGDASLDRMTAHAVTATGTAGVELVGMMLISVLPMTLVILAGHFVARGLKTTSPLAYFGIGLAAPPILAAVSMFLFLLIAVMIMLPTAVAMVIYRSMAGLEPAPVKEDIRTNDPRRLVPADHPRRAFGRVISTRRP
jgi:hypothetical protein